MNSGRLDLPSSGPIQPCAPSNRCTTIHLGDPVIPVVIAVVVIIALLVLLDVYFYKSLVGVRAEVDAAWAALEQAQASSDPGQVATAAKVYNASVAVYNTKIETVPWSAIARRFKFESRQRRTERYDRPQRLLTRRGLPT